MTINLYLNDVLKDTQTVSLAQQGDSVALIWPGLHSAKITLVSVTAPPSPSTGRIDEYKVTQLKYAQGVAIRNSRTAVRVEERVTAYFNGGSERVDIPGSPFSTSYAYRNDNTWTVDNYHEPNYQVSWPSGNYSDALRESSTTIDIRLSRTSFTYLPIRNRANTGLVRGNTTQLVLRDGDA